jgi:hypothetical protein
MFTAAEIHEKLKKEAEDAGRKPVIYGTIKNDIVAVRKRWKADLAELDKLEGEERYLSATADLRRLALDEGSAKGLKIAMTANQEIARLSGVDLKIDDNTVRVIDVEQAKEYIDKILNVVWDEVTDTDAQLRIQAGIDALAAEGN